MLSDKVRHIYALESDCSTEDILKLELTDLSKKFAVSRGLSCQSWYVGVQLSCGGTWTGSSAHNRYVYCQLSVYIPLMTHGLLCMVSG